MGIVFRQSVKTLFVIFSGALIGAIILWLSTKYIPKQQLGFMNNFTKWAITLSLFVPLGLSNTLSVYIHRYANDPAKKKLLISICLFFPLLTIVIVSVIYFLLRHWILHHFQPGDAVFMGEYFNWLPLYTLLFFFTTVMEQYLGSQMKVAISAFMREVVLRVANLVLILLFAFGYISFNFLVIASILVYFIPAMIYLYLSFRTKGFGVSFHLSGFTKAEYKEIIHFSWYHFLLGITVILLTYMDALFIPFYDANGFSSLAVYGVASYIVTLLYMPYKALSPASFPELAVAFNQNDMEKAKDIFARSSLNLLIAIIGLAILLCCNLQNAVDIIGNGKNYSGIVVVFVVIMAGQVINFATGMNDQVLSIANYYKFNFFVSLIIIAVYYLLIRFLIPRYSIYGAAWSNTITIVIYNIIKFLFVWKKLDMQPFSKNTILVVLAGLPALAAGYFFPHFFDPARHVYIHTFIDAAMRSVVIVITYILMLIWLKPSKDLEVYLASIKKNKRLF